MSNAFTWLSPKLPTSRALLNTPWPVIVRGDGHAPGRVERGDGPARDRRAGGEPLDEMAARVELVDEAVADARDVVVLVGVLQGIGDEQRAVDVLDAERSEPGEPIAGGGGSGR